MRDFLKDTNDEIDYKEKNLEAVGDVITVMNGLWEIEKRQDQHILQLDMIEEMLCNFEKLDDKKEYRDHLKESRKLQEDWRKLV